MIKSPDEAGNFRKRLQMDSFRLVSMYFLKVGVYDATVLDEFLRIA